VHHTTPHCTALCLISSHQTDPETATATGDGDRRQREIESEREKEREREREREIKELYSRLQFHYIDRRQPILPCYIPISDDCIIIPYSSERDLISCSAPYNLIRLHTLQNMSYHTIPYNSIQFVHRPFIPRYLLCTVYEAFSSSLHLHHTVLHNDMTSILY
jgi:hypothetical protein